MTAPTNVSFYADPKGLASLRNEAKAQDPRALKEVAKQFESLFTQMLMKSMRESNKALSNGDSLFGSDQADFYQDMFDQQMAVHLSQGQGLGLADMLVRQLSQAAPARLETGGRGPEIGNSNAAASSALQPAASSLQPVAMSREEFIRQMLPHAEKAARQLGVDPQALVAQAALETGWGKSMPCNADGTCSYNMFGIKAGSSWSGATAKVPTVEFEEGVAVRKVDSFRAYASPAESFADYARLIRSNPRYGDALNTGSDVSGFASALQEGGYATDPNYARKITAVARELKALISPEQVKSADSAPISDYSGVRS